ncbi:TonB-dependent receptor [uncultured Paraglaciecola sp.]|uniref:TonB-dependent receptor n=1 Tax=uncultured Paraglaciecola sp. TaxID=1765024 RepID=UPI002598D308|nr:TonB-dependent receptor [uncultured Paraglaciecola sp.]
MQKRFIKQPLVLAVIAGLSSVSAASLAQSNQDAGNQDIEKIEVNGFRGSLLKARDLKREALGSQDSIVAEDIADFPDLNLADALQRIPGIAITREGGEGRQISLRGLGPDFTQVQLNGMEALGTSSSAMDSRGSISRSRAFDFNIFASELFNRVDVSKSFSANMDEGGIGGTVNLVTAKPFDYDGFKGAVSGQIGKNTLADGTSPRIAGLISNTWGDFGALASVAYSKRNTSEQGFDTYRWRLRNSQGSDISALSEADQAAVNSGELRFSRGSRYSTFDNEQTRVGATVALQYRPSDSFKLGFDGLYGVLDNARDEFHLQSRGSSSTALGCTGPTYVNIQDVANEPICSSLLDIEYNAGNEVIYSHFDNAALHSESRQQYADTTFTQMVLNSEWNVNQDFTLTALLGTSSSEFETGSTKVYLESFGEQTIDYRQDRFYGVNTYGYDVTDVNEYRYHEVDLEEDQIENSFDIAKIDGVYVFDNAGAISAGLSLKTFENEAWENSQGNLLRTEWEQGDVSDIVDPSLTYTYTGHKEQEWLAVDVNGVLNAFGIDNNLAKAEYSDKVTEDTLGAYLQYEFEADFAGGFLRGNLGARYYDTQISSFGVVNGELAEVTQDYSGVLPTVNLAWDATDNLVVRASLGKNITRPSLSALNAAGTVENDPNSTNGLSISAGNPNLEPFESNNFEMALEYYFEEVGYVSFAYFNKSIDNFIVTDTTEMAYGDTGYALSFLGEVDELGNPQSADTIFTVIQPINTDKSDIVGYELAFQRDFDFLPAPFNHLGMIANYTYADGEALYRNVGNTGVDEYKSFPGLSEHSGNFTIYYEQDTWGARVSAAHRSDYISNVSSNSDEDERGFHATTYVDFSAFYNVSEQVKVTIEGTNLTDVREEQYSDSADRLYNTTKNGRTFYVGATYSF